MIETINWILSVLNYKLEKRLFLIDKWRFRSYHRDGGREDPGTIYRKKEHRLGITSK